jgi:hypothetical protein
VKEGFYFFFKKKFNGKEVAKIINAFCSKFIKNLLWALKDCTLPEQINKLGSACFGMVFYYLKEHVCFAFGPPPHS